MRIPVYWYDCNHPPSPYEKNDFFGGLAYMDNVTKIQSELFASFLKTLK